MENLLLITVQSSILILALLLMRRVFLGKINPILQYGLWGIVALRLLVPVQIKSVTSLFNLTAQSAASPAMPGQSASFADTALSELPASLIPAEIPSSGLFAPAPVENSMGTQELVVAVLAAIWVVGMAAMLVYTLAVNIRFYRHVSKTGIRRNGYVLCRNLPSPCLIGFFHPTIVLNAGAEKTDVAKEYVILHEKTHLRHGDPYWALLRTVCCVIYWFHPLVWVAASVCRRDQEIACDYAVTRDFDEEKSLAYGETLIALIRKKKTLPSLSTAMASSKKDIRQRLRLIADRPRMLKITAVALAALVFGVCAIACTGAVTGEPGGPVVAEEPKNAKMTLALHEPDNPAANAQGWLVYTTEDAAEIETLADILTADTVEAGNCEFGALRILLESGSERTLYVPAMDDCATVYAMQNAQASDLYEDIRYDNENFYMLSEANRSRLDAFVTACFPQSEHAWTWMRHAGEEGTGDAPVRSFDRTTMDGAVSEFLTRYFEDMASGNTDWGWNAQDNTQYEGLIAYTNFYYEQFCYLKQWIDFTAFCREDGTAMDRGRFDSLTVEAAGVAGSSVPGLEEYVLDGYFRTTVMGTLVRVGLVRSDAGEYQVVCVEFPDWMEYQNFKRECFEYFTSHGVTDPNSYAYIESLRRERDGLAEKREEWKSGALDSERFSNDGATVALSDYGAALAANGTRQTQSMRESADACDRFVRVNDLDVELLVAQTARGALSEETDLIGYATDNAQWPEPQFAEAVSFSETTEFDPDAFFVQRGTPVTRLVRQLKCYGNGHVYTTYYAQFSQDGGDVVLLFRFLNANRDLTGAWHVYQTEADCESWMQTLTFTGERSSPVSAGN